MKDKQFLEQLNLYLDGEIDSADAAELEREILSNPARRRIYNDYCRIHRATKLVYQQFRAAGAASGVDALPPAHPNGPVEGAAEPVALGGRTGGRAALRPFRRLAFGSGLAAACAVGVFISTRTPAPRTPEAVAPAPTVAITESPAETPVVIATPVAEPPATFAAPFAPATRPDPFVQVAPSRNDPFALTPWTIADDESPDALPSIFNPPVLRVDERFRPASLVTPTDSPGGRDSDPFRLRVNNQSTTAPSTAPVEFRAQP